MTIRSKTLLFLIGLSVSCSDPIEKPLKTWPPSQPDYNFSPPAFPCPGQFFCFASENFESVHYTPATAFPGAFGASASFGERVFFAGGHEEGTIGSVLSNVNIFNITTSQWFERQLSVPRSYLAAASAGEKVLFAGGSSRYAMTPVYGGSDEFYDIVDIFDGKNLTSVVGHLSEKRAHISSVSTTTKAYFIGGWNPSGYSSTMDVYDAELSSWSVVEMPLARGYASAVIVNNKIYVCGGQNGSANLTGMDVYDIGTGQWSSFQTPHLHPIASAVVLGDRIFIAGGDGYSSGPVDIFNTVDETWSSVSLSDSRFYIAAVSVENKLIFFGGAFSRNVDIYDGFSDTWSVATLSDGVTGVASTSALGQCFFMGFLYGKGNSLTNSMMIIRP